MLLPIRTVIVVAWFFLGSALVLPILLLRPGHPGNTIIYTRTVLRSCLWLCGLTLEIRNRSVLYSAQPCVYVANHQNVIDLFIHGSYHPIHAVTVGKKSIAWIPIFGWIYALVGSVLIDRKNHSSAMSSMNSALELLRSGKKSIWIFAEGTRSNGRGLLPFKKGAFHLAINSGRPLVPIATSQLYKTVNLNKLKAGKVIVEVLAPIPTTGLKPEDAEGLLHQAREMISQTIDRLDRELLQNA